MPCLSMRNRLRAGFVLICGIVTLAGNKSKARGDDWAVPGKPPSFVEDVIPLLTRLGCNQGACHGKNEGRNGFRLSLRGYAPEWDIERLTRESRGRRVNLALPEESLLLKKPTGAVPHGGGMLIQPGSREYRMLLEWIQAGAPGPAPDEPHVKTIALAPVDLSLKLQERRQMTVTATYTDGRHRDVTWLTQFAVNDAGVLEVSPTGEIKALRQGATAVRAHFHGQVTVATMTIPFDRPLDAARLAQRNNLIDEHVFNKLAALRIPPADLCSDQAFIRRATLDATGTLPTPDEIRSFIADSDPHKRARWIDSLLERPEYVDYWTLLLGDLFQNRKERDHDVRGAKGVRDFQAWLREQVAANRPWDELVRTVLTASGKSSDRPEVGYYIVNVGEQQNADKSEIVSAVAQAFLGTRIGCAKCHNHPLEKYTQDDYYRFAAYFSAIKLQRFELRKGTTTLSFAALNKDQRHGVTQPRTGQFLTPQAIDGTPCTAGPAADPREQLAAWVTDPKNEYFAGAMVNRLWSHFFSTGLVEPIDDLRASNPPSNPELWRAVVHEFVEHHFDLKHIMRLVMNSRAYQLSSTTQPENEADTRFYSHYIVRRLGAEVLLDAVSQTTGVPEPFSGYAVGTRAIQLPDPTVDSYFLTQFGRPERVTACACERRNEVTITQLLELQNGDGMARKVNAGDGRLAALLKETPDNRQVADELFLATLAREPSDKELAAIEAEIGAGGTREEVLRDLFWALLNSKDFAFNH